MLALTKGSRLLLRVVAGTITANAVIEAKVLCRRFGNNKLDPYTLSAIAPMNRTISDNTGRVVPTVEADSEVVAAALSTPGNEFSRGQCFGWLYASDPGAGIAIQSLVRGYIYDTHIPSLGFYESSLSGRGFFQYNAIADDIAPAIIQHTLASTNTLRRILGFIWYYHASGDIADRLLVARLRDVGNGLPTGMTSGANTSVKQWPSAGNLTLSANQEGVIYVNAQDGKSFAVSVDNGTKTIEDITTQPDPFPLTVQEDNVGEILFNLTDEEAADRQSIYIISEEWIRT